MTLIKVISVDLINMTSDCLCFLMIAF